MERQKLSDFARRALDVFSESRPGHIDRRSVLGLTAGAAAAMMRSNRAWAQAGKAAHPASARVVEQLRTRFTFQISVDVATLQQGLGIASAALKGR